MLKPMLPFFLNLTKNFLQEFESYVFSIFGTDTGSAPELPMRVVYIQPK